jgi:primosomal protein N' (replication factor Y)
MFVKIAIDVPLYQLFDYNWDEGKLRTHPKIGQIVKVEFGKQLKTGIVLQIEKYNWSATDQIKTIKDVLEVAPVLEIDEGLIRLCQFVSKYYLKPVGEILFSSIPSEWKKPERWEFLSKQKEKNLYKLTKKYTKTLQKWELNHEQIAALEELNKASQQNTYKLFLLKGITGSGKTAVYLEWLKTILREKESQCLILVPEINLTPQLEKIIEEVFVGEDITVLHSNITPAKRNLAWWKIQNGLSRVIVGTRLSIFAPIPNLKGIVVDEEHDYSYKQQEGLRYNARDLAIWRASDCNIPIVLTTATPSSETWQKVEQNKIKVLELTKKAKKGATPTKIHLINLIQAKKTKTVDENGISEEVKKIIEKTWKNNKQSLIYINRRGYSPILHCGACNWKTECKRCSAWMVVHKKRGKTNQLEMQCHHCGLVSEPPKACPICGNQDLSPIGMGTQKIEEYFEKQYPEIEIIRIDSDSTKSKRGATELFEKVHDGKPYLIIGTQMISKGHDFQNIQNVIILDVDKSLYSQDYRAVEKIFSQLVQVSGRSGRSGESIESNVYIQTEFVEHPIFSSLIANTYDQFFDEILQERRQANLPPYSYQALIIVESKTSPKNIEILNEIKEYLVRKKYKNTEIYDPTPRMLHRLSGVERDQILIESKDRAELQELLETALDLIETIKKESRSIKIHIDRDPLMF